MEDTLTVEIGILISIVVAIIALIGLIVNYKNTKKANEHRKIENAKEDSEWHGQINVTLQELVKRFDKFETTFSTTKGNLFDKIEKAEKAMDDKIDKTEKAMDGKIDKRIMEHEGRYHAR